MIFSLPQTPNAKLHDAVKFNSGYCVNPNSECCKKAFLPDAKTIGYTDQNCEAAARNCSVNSAYH